MANFTHTYVKREGRKDVVQLKDDQVAGYQGQNSGTYTHEYTNVNNRRDAVQSTTDNTLDLSGFVTPPVQYTHEYDNKNGERRDAVQVRVDI